jgi:DNA-binding NtrC family response regulator
MATLLLVDDDEAFRSMLRRALQRRGHDVIEAAEGGAALRAVSGATVDLVITDIVMPDMEGLDTIRALRRTHPELNVIAMSGGGRVKPESYLQAAKAFGAVSVFSKPFDNEKLFAAIDDVLK